MLESAAGSLIAAAVIAGALIPMKGRVFAWWKRLRQPEQGSWAVIAVSWIQVVGALLALAALLMLAGELHNRSNGRLSGIRVTCGNGCSDAE